MEQSHICSPIIVAVAPLAFEFSRLPFRLDQPRSALFDQSATTMISRRSTESQFLSVDSVLS